jgi:hypothetical protein
LDEDGLYDPCNFNDRLLLGLKGTMSEAELHILKARLRGGVLSKARRGELAAPLPIGLVYDPVGRVVLDPDVAVQRAIYYLFDTFERTGSARAVVMAFASESLLFPLRARSGPHKGELFWSALRHCRVLHLLHNPRYAGAFAFGRHRQRKGPDGASSRSKLARDQWTALIPGAHAGYITWDAYEANQARLAANARARGDDRRAGPPREGPALLQGMVVCGRCGARMTVRYHYRRGDAVPDYVCQRDSVQSGTPNCQIVPGAGLDRAVGRVLLDSLTPLAIEVAFTVASELDARAEEADYIRRQHVDRARYEADVAQRRYLAVDPANRLVADALEADWNDKLRELAQAQDDCERSQAR